MNGEWKWTLELLVPFAVPALALALAGVGWCLWRESRLEQAFDIWDTRLAEVDGDVSVLLEADRDRLIAERALAEDATVERLDAIPHGGDWQYPDGWLEAA